MKPILFIKMIDSFIFTDKIYNSSLTYSSIADNRFYLNMLKNRQLITLRIVNYDYVLIVVVDGKINLLGGLKSKGLEQFTLEMTFSIENYLRGSIFR